MPSEQYVKAPSSPRVIVAAVIIAGGRVLACQRSSPPEAAGKWEFPGGKVERGETDQQALARECREELGISVEVGARVGPDVPLAHGRAVLRVFAVEVLDGGVPEALEHAAMRWLAVDQLDSVPWLPADVPIVAELPALLA
ncbi:DNA mismatch repair protein MutT [Actinoplanes ianthinogenes]|uniref:8-oxo-dGTP diphosphatase n=1 Tax=Actinoplanes ianthinogenes TaxID=122358 RepID=A0ABM7LU87_9ACTN|nr:(deoxy)nucleoside triphosphate pyrophosphohydrolase [Actinoplanes ianthinogenes]BCJ42865.1 DNA mismatch repair protein MutT [Actinoplanes ianthinogenes]GGQ91694.1 DNA mismatch repair protein MutT [Actinoplanes ianthinogenes]